MKNGADVISASSGCDDCFSQSLLDAIRRADAAGVLFVTTAGNRGANNTLAHYPCNYTSPNVICAAATDDRDALASFSNYGSSTVDLGAPAWRSRARPPAAITRATPEPPRRRPTSPVSPPL